MSAIEKLEKRVSELEAEVARLKTGSQQDNRPWWEKIYGTFANDPHYEEAMELGRKYRESFRPKSRKKKKKSSKG